jgi:hypothetical protein
VVVEAPDAVGTGRFECVCEDQAADDFEISLEMSVSCLGQILESDLLFKDTKNDAALNVTTLGTIFERPELP